MSVQAHNFVSPNLIGDWPWARNKPLNTITKPSWRPSWFCLPAKLRAIALLRPLLAQPAPSSKAAMNNYDPLQLLTINQTAALMQVSTRTVRRLIETKALKPVRIGRAIRVQRLQVQHLISSST